MPSLLFCLFFLSGFSALIYEVAWVRILGLVLGNTAQAASCVMAAFLGGLALGAMLGGKLADGALRQGTKRFAGCSPLLLYGIVEIGAACLAPIITLGLAGLAGVIEQYHHLLPSSPQWLGLTRFTVAAVMMVVPTVLMGATLPLLTTFFAHRWNKPAHFFNSLYLVNTLGAVFGSLACAFIGFAYFGLIDTVLIAAGISASAGIMAIAASRRLPVSPANNQAQRVARDDAQPATSASLKFLCFLSFGLGLASLSYEVLWTRQIRCYIAPDTYAFTLMVGTFLLGLTIGSAIYGKFIEGKARTVGAELANFALVQFAAALACASSLLFEPLAFLLRHAIEPPIYYILHGSPLASLIVQLAITFAFMLLPCTLIGISFPMIGGLVAAHEHSLGAAVGKVYAANTLGCVLGSALCGLVALPLIGTFSSFQMAVAVTVLIGCAALVASNAPRLSKNVFGAAAIVLLAAFLSTHSPFLDLLKAQNQSAHHQLVRFAEDDNSTVMVFKNDGKPQLIVNGQPYANTILKGRRYMRVLGHLPVLLHPHPRTALTICFGTGTTAGSIALHPEVEHLDIVDLSRAVVDSAPYFISSNHGVATNPKVTMHVNDGRNYLLTTDKKFDVLTFEPPPPREAGVVNLYSVEFYELAKRHMDENGIVCQWIPADQESVDMWKMMIGSARKAFKFVSVWDPNDDQAVLLCSDKPIHTSVAELNARIHRSPEVAENLAEVGLGDAKSLLASFLFSQNTVDAMTAGLPLITDDHPRLEFYLPYAGAPLHCADLAMNQADLAEIAGSSLAADPAFQQQVKALQMVRLAVKNPGDRKGSLECAMIARKLAPDNAYCVDLEHELWKPRRE